MSNTIRDGYNAEVILQLMRPKTVNVSAADYHAESIGFGFMDQGAVRPFIIAEFEQVTLKVETWLGFIETFTFTPGPYPLPLRRIFTDAGNSKPNIQISY